MITTRQRRASAALEPRPARRSPGAVAYVVLIVWISAVLALIAAGVFETRDDPPVALMATVAGPLLAFAVAHRASTRVRAWVLDVDPTYVIGGQLWRVVGIAFLYALAFGELPAAFAWPAGIGDLATGIAALGVISALGRRTLTRSRLYAFTALGVGDFLVAIAVGLALRPDALDLWPLVVFPTVMVPFFTVLHAIAILQARAGRLIDRME